VTAARTGEWLAWRGRGIGASDIAGILGISPWSSPYSVWQSKVGGYGSDGPGSEAMRWGTLLEDAVLDEAARRLGVTVTERQVRREHPDHVWARATLDGTYADGPDIPPWGHEADAGVLEAKVTSDPRWHEVPVYYEVQCQWQMEVAGLPRAWVAALHGGRRLSLWTLERDPDTGAGLIGIAAAFWERHVLGGQPPPVDGRPATTRALNRRYGTAVPELAADLGDLEAEIGRLRDIRQSQKALDDERTLLENRVREALGDAETGTAGGETVVTWRPYVRRSLDLDRLRDEQPQIAGQYTVRHQLRLLLLK
jgi:putative phage-type endonuclease